MEEGYRKKIQRVAFKSEQNFQVMARSKCPQCQHRRSWNKVVSATSPENAQIKFRKIYQLCPECSKHGNPVNLNYDELIYAEWIIP